MDEVSGGSGCYTSFPITTCGDYVICPNAPQQRIGQRCTSYTVGVPIGCSGGSSSGGGGYTYIPYLDTGSTTQGNSGTVPQPQPAIITTACDCECRPDGILPCAVSSCCYQGGKIPNNPISDLNQCPKRVPTHDPKWEVRYDGCTLVPDDPTGAIVTRFSNAEHTGACDLHDKCYQTCWKRDLDAARLACDDLLLTTAFRTCETISNVDPELGQTCKLFASIYWGVLRAIAKPVFIARQKEVCNCCH